MQLKVPPGNLSWLSALWVLLSGFMLFSGFAAGDKFLSGVCILFSVAGVLIWLDARAIAWPMIIWFSVVIVGAVLLLEIKGLAFRPFWAIAMAGLTIYDLYQWQSSE